MSGPFLDGIICGLALSGAAGAFALAFARRRTAHHCLDCLRRIFE